MRSKNSGQSKSATWVDIVHTEVIETTQSPKKSRPLHWKRPISLAVTMWSGFRSDHFRPRKVRSMRILEIRDRNPGAIDIWERPEGNGPTMWTECKTMKFRSTSGSNKDKIKNE